MVIIEPQRRLCLIEGRVDCVIDRHHFVRPVVVGFAAFINHLGDAGILQVPFDRFAHRIPYLQDTPVLIADVDRVAVGEDLLHESQMLC